MNKADAEEYTQALGQVVAGGWRQIALGQRLGVPQALGLETDQWVKERLGGYVKMSIEETREAAKTLEAEGLSQREIAAITGASKSAVNRVLAPVPNGTSRNHDPVKVDVNVKPTVPSGTTHDPIDVVTALAATNELRKKAEQIEAKAEAAAETRAKRLASQRAQPRADGYEFRAGDAREVLADVEPESVHLILTDPPYGDDAEPLYQWLAEWSARVLVDGGSLICFTGQSRLDRDMRIFSAHLRWWWLMAMRHNQAQRLPGKFVIAEFKPVLWFVKEHRRGRTLVNDVLRSDRRDKDGHDWGQGDGGVELLIQQLTEPDERIVDPFAGTGQWGQIAHRMGRCWLGADVVPGGDAVVVA